MHEDQPLAGEAYWVIERRLLAGAYPGAASPAETRKKLECVLSLGVTTFVDLTEEGEGPPLLPYAPVLRDLGGEPDTRLTHLRLPIRDFDVPSTWVMRAILNVLDTALDAGENVYLHCWGGVGRTGTVIACYLLEHGARPDEVLTRLQALRANSKRADRSSPETDAQRAFIAAWSHR